MPNLQNNPFNKGWKYSGNTTKPGNPLWDEYVNESTKEKTLKTITPKLVADFNCDHNYSPIDGSNAQCSKCGHGQKIVWGLQIIKDGKIISNH